MQQLKQNRLTILLALIFFASNIYAQDNTTLLHEANNLELKFDEAGALTKYKQVALNDPANLKALVKSTELNCRIGSRMKDINSKTGYYQEAFTYAQMAYIKDSTNSDACYAMALVNYKMNELDPDNKKLVENIRQIKFYSDKSLAANANNAKANYVLGMWHFEMIHSGWLKKQGVKSFYNQIPDTQLDSATYYMEKARTIEPYFAQDYLDLAKAYIYDRQPAKALDVLNKLVKLPTRIYDDTAYKEEAKQLLAKIQ